MMTTRKVAADVSHILNSFYSMEGLLCLTKWGISSMKLLSLSSRAGNLFQHALPVFEAQKSLYYATKTLSSLPRCIKVDPITKRTILQMPQMRDLSGIDWIAFCYIIGGIFGTGAFIQKSFQVNFGLYSAIGKYVGSIPVYRSQGEWVTSEQVPIVNHLSLGPRDFFFILASALEIYRWINPFFTDRFERAYQRQCQLIPLLQLTASVARLIGLSSYRHFARSQLLIVIEFIGHNASLIRFSMLAHRYRQQYLVRP